MTWQYVTGDKYNLDDLHEYLEFFEEDLAFALADLVEAMQYAKYGLPNWRTVILRREMGVEESRENLATCKRAILEQVNNGMD